MAKKSKESRIRDEMDRIWTIYADMAPKKKALAAGLIERAAFMRVQCEELEADLLANGWTEKFCQGNQEPYDRARPQGQAYQTLNANYQKIVKQLDSMLPQRGEDEAPKSDGFEEFVNGRDE